MRSAGLILLIGAVLPAAEEVTLRADRLRHVLVLKHIYLNGQGPFRLMIDTGAASCVIRPAIARQLALRPVYRVQQDTPSGLKPVPAVILDDVRVGPASDRAVEAMVTDTAVREIDGVLGQSWLVRHNYLLDYRGHRLVLNAREPGHGVRAALRTSDGRTCIAAEVDGRPQELVVDSGAANLILFERSTMGREAAEIMMVLTNSGSIESGMRMSRIEIGGVYSRALRAAVVNAPRRAGLLPAAAFASVYISNREGVVVLVP
jgi:predicted aspartyl protease